MISGHISLRRLCLAAVMVPLLGLISWPAHADTDGPSFPLPATEWAPLDYLCVKVANGPVIDGNLGDAAWDAASWTADFVDIEGELKPAPTLPTRVKMLWDDEYFYVGAEIEEPHLWGTLTERDAVIYHDNDFEIFIDPDGDTHEYYELEINALGTEWDLYLVRPYRDGGPALNAWDIQGLKSAIELDGTLNQPGDSDRGWSVEIAIPWRVLAESAHRDSPPNRGDAWRVNFSRVQWRIEPQGEGYAKRINPATRKPFPENNWVWSPQGLINMHYPERWGFVHFGSAGDRIEAGATNPWEKARHLLRLLYYKQQSYHSLNGEYATHFHKLASYPPEMERAEWATATARCRLVGTPEHFVIGREWPGGGRLHISSDGRTWLSQAKDK